MSEKEKNMGAGPSKAYYGNKDGKGIKDTREAHKEHDKQEVHDRQTDRSSGRADQEKNAERYLQEEGNDDLDKFDLNSLKGNVENAE